MFDQKKYYRLELKNSIQTPLSQFGFKFYEKNSICRMTEDDVLQVISFIKSRYGDGNFKVSISIRPMYCPHEVYLTSSPGNELYCIATNNKAGKYWNYSTETKANESFKEIFELINKYALPFFDATKDSSKIISCYERNFWGQRKFGNRIYWGTVGWENYDFGHIYLRAGKIGKSIEHFNDCYKEFKSDSRDWAQSAAKKCLEIKNIIAHGQTQIENYINETIKDSKEKLKLASWDSERGSLQQLSGYDDT